MHQVKHLIWIALKQMLGALTFHLLRFPKVMGFFFSSFQMGTNYKAALIPQRIRETIHGWGKAARRRRRLGIFADDSTIHTDTSTVMSIEEDDQELLDAPGTAAGSCTEIELQPACATATSPSPVANETSSRVGTPLLRPSASVSSSVALTIKAEGFLRSSSMPTRGEKISKEISRMISVGFIWITEKKKRERDVNIRAFHD
jgi:hypothetical protein